MKNIDTDQTKLIRILFRLSPAQVVKIIGRRSSKSFLLLMLILVPIYLFGQNQKASKYEQRRDKVYFTPQLAGTSPNIKQQFSDGTVVPASSSTLKLDSHVNKLLAGPNLTSQQFFEKVNSMKNMTPTGTIYAGSNDQFAPAIATKGGAMAAAFVDYDTQSGSYPYGTLDVYASTDKGTTWSSLAWIAHPNYPISSPQITFVGTQIVTSFILNGAVTVSRIDLNDGSIKNYSVSTPTVSTGEMAIAQHLCTDVEKYSNGNAYCYLAYIFQHANGTKEVLFSRSKDTSKTWTPYYSLGQTTVELGVPSIGLDYCASGLYAGYLGSGANAGKIVLRKSTNFGVDTSWSSEVIFHGEGTNKKVGPVIAASGQKIVLAYQYDYGNDATDWKTASDFDIEGVISNDGGSTWQDCYIAIQGSKETLPCISHDADSSFYVGYLKNNRMSVSMAGAELAFGFADSSSTSNVNLNYFPGIFGNPNAGIKNAYAAWTGVSNGLDIFSSTVTLKIPPLSPTNIITTPLSSAEIKISWSDNSTDETGFRIDWCVSTSSVFTNYATVSANTTSYVVSGLIPSTEYIIAVRSYNDNGNSLRYGKTETTLPVIGSILSVNPTTLAFANTAVGATSSEKTYSLSGSALTPSSGSITVTAPAAFEVSLSSGSGFSSTLNVPYTGGALTKIIYVHFKPTSVTSYGGNITNTGGGATAQNVSVTGDVDIPPPAVPSASGATDLKTISFTANWNSVSGAAGYRLDVATNNGYTVFVTGFNNKDVANVTTFPVTGLNANTTYYYRVRSYNSGGTSTSSNTITVITPPPSGPVITHTEYSSEVVVSNGTAQPVTISASASDASGVSTMTLKYRQVGGSGNGSVPFSSFNNGSAQIPGNAFLNSNTAIGIDYRIEAANTLGYQSATRWYSITVRNGAGTTVQPSFSWPKANDYPGTEQQAYRIFSVPYNLDNHTPGFAARCLGGHSNKDVAYYNWRLQMISNGNKIEYDDFKNQQVCYPGTGFFFITRNAGTINLDPIQDPHTLVKAYDLSTTGISLTGGINGWYLLGTPLNTAISWDSLEFVGASPLDHAFFSGSWDHTVNQLIPWQGLAVKTTAPCTVLFKTGVAGSIPKHGITPQMAKDAAAVSQTSPHDWIVSVHASRSDIQMSCNDGGFGMHLGASLDHDQFDLYEPPSVGNKTVSFGFSGPNGPRVRDVRPLDENGGIWDMKLTTIDAGARVKLDFNGVLNIPDPEFEVYLLDLDAKIAYDLKSTASFDVGSGNGSKDFRIIAGKKAFVRENNSGVDLYPAAMTLYTNYPNPFNPETIIRYTVPNASPSYTVTLKIFNVLGQEISTLVNAQQKSGYYEVRYTALKQSSGVYFYQIKVSDGTQIFSDVKKMMMLK